MHPGMERYKRLIALPSHKQEEEAKIVFPKAEGEINKHLSNIIQPLERVKLFKWLNKQNFPKQKPGAFKYTCVHGESLSCSLAQAP